MTRPDHVAAALQDMAKAAPSLTAQDYDEALLDFVLKRRNDGESLADATARCMNIETYSKIYEGRLNAQNRERAQKIHRPDGMEAVKRFSKFIPVETPAERASREQMNADAARICGKGPK